MCGKLIYTANNLISLITKWNWSDLKHQDKFGGHGYVKPTKTKWERLPDDKGYDSRKKELEEHRKKAAREQAAEEKAAGVASTSDTSTISGSHWKRPHLVW